MEDVELPGYTRPRQHEDTDDGEETLVDGEGKRPVGCLNRIQSPRI